MLKLLITCTGTCSRSASASFSAQDSAASIQATALLSLSSMEKKLAIFNIFEKNASNLFSNTPHGFTNCFQGNTVIVGNGNLPAGSARFFEVAAGQLFGEIYNLWCPDWGKVNESITR